jgi:hypothetical protein
MSLNYPLNPDTSFESFFFTDDAKVTLALGKTYPQSELVPINYEKVMLRVVGGFLLENVPVREFVSIYQGEDATDINASSLTDVQQAAFSAALTNLYNYWDLKLLNGVKTKIVGGMVTEMTTKVVAAPLAIPANNIFQIVTTFKVNWFVTQNNPLA